MKKLRRLLTSGYLFTILFLLVEVLIVIFFELGADTYIFAPIIQQNPSAAKILTTINQVFVIARVVAFVLAVIIFFRVINKYEDPEFKVPWLVFLFVFPLATVTFFLIFKNHGLPRKETKYIRGYLKELDPYYEHNRIAFSKYEEELGRARGAFQYVLNTARVGAFKNNRVTYYPVGDKFFPDLIEGLKQAEKFIFIEFFIITDGKLWGEVKDILIKKAQEGVDVRIVYDDLGCNGTISFSTPRRLAKYGIKCYKFHPLKPILSGVYNNRDHRKIVVIDHKMAFTGGNNLADEYANIIKRFGYWKDTMVKIEGTAISNLITTFIENYDIAAKEITPLSPFLDFDYPTFEDEGFVMPFGDGPGFYTNDHMIGEQNYINILNYATKKVYISTPYLIPTFGLMEAMRNATLRGVDVHLIVPGIPDKKLVYKVAKSNFKPLLKAGIHIYIYTPGFNHMKTALADDELAFVGTINFDFRSLVHHFECGTLLYKNPCIKEISQDFRSMINDSQLVPIDYKLGLFSRSICGLIKIITPLL